MTCRPKLCCLLVVSAWLLAACGRHQADPFAALPTQAYRIEPATVSLLEKYRASQSHLRSLSGRTRGSATEDGKRRPFRQVFALAPPSSMRIEIESSVGQTLALFICDGETLYYKQRDVDEPTVAPASAEAVAGTLGYEMEAEELVATLLGRIAPLQLEVGQVVQRAGDVVFLPDPSRPGRLQYGFDVQGGVLRSRTYFSPDGARRIVVRYLGYTSVEGQIVPGQLQIRDLASSDTVELTVTKLTLNPALRPAIFLPPAPR